MRNKVIFGNWKMHKTIQEAVDFINDFDSFAYECKKKGIVVGIAPSFLALEALQVKATYTIIASQNVNENNDGAYTGEISIPMLKEIGVLYSLVGHSERRNYYNETNISCNAKIKALSLNNMFAIYCVGENLSEYENGLSKDVVKRQLVEGLKDLKSSYVKNMIIAYEPVWSIGTGHNASSSIAEDMCCYIRETLKELYGEEVANSIIIQYGGSVNKENAKEYLSQNNVDGVLVGGASLKLEDFKDIISSIF